MAEKILFVDLNDPQMKSVGEVITSPTSRKILSYLTDKKDTEGNISQTLGVPLSTVHYHLQKLLEVGLVKVSEFHYSQKGREVNHYSLALQFIVIGPRTEGILSKLKTMMPVAGICIGISGVLYVLGRMSAAGSERAMQAAMPSAESVALNVAPVVSSEPNLALWFLTGSGAALSGYFLYELIRYYKMK